MVFNAAWRDLAPEPACDGDRELLPPLPAPHDGRTRLRPTVLLRLPARVLPCALDPRSDVDHCAALPAAAPSSLVLSSA